jgi:carbon storage regulator CsrA
MLVLSRKVGEQICVPTCKLVLTVLEVRGARVRLGFAAPAEIAVVREELCRHSSHFPSKADAGATLGEAVATR